MDLSPHPPAVGRLPSADDAEDDAPTRRRPDSGETEARDAALRARDDALRANDRHSVSEAIASFPRRMNIDMRRAQPDDSKLMCPVCLCLLQDPFQPECGHPLCKACYDCLVPGASCPTCRGPVLASRNMFVARMINEVVVTCANQGCHASYALGARYVNELTHGATCKLGLVKCHACKLNNIPRAEMDSHVSDHCTKRVWTCLGCSETMPLADKAQHELATGRLPCAGHAECPNACASDERPAKRGASSSSSSSAPSAVPVFRSYRKSALVAHLLYQCPSALVMCTLCCDRYPRSEEQAHNEDNHARHMACLTRSVSVAAHEGVQLGHDFVLVDTQLAVLPRLVLLSCDPGYPSIAFASEQMHVVLTSIGASMRQMKKGAGRVRAELVFNKQAESALPRAFEYALQVGLLLASAPADPPGHVQAGFNVVRAPASCTSVVFSVALDSDKRQFDVMALERLVYGGQAVCHDGRFCLRFQLFRRPASAAERPRDERPGSQYARDLGASAYASSAAGRLYAHRSTRMAASRARTQHAAQSAAASPLIVSDDDDDSSSSSGAGGSNAGSRHGSGNSGDGNNRNGGSSGNGGGSSSVNNNRGSSSSNNSNNRGSSSSSSSNSRSGNGGSGNNRSSSSNNNDNNEDEDENEDADEDEDGDEEEDAE